MSKPHIRRASIFTTKFVVLFVPLTLAVIAGVTVAPSSRSQTSPNPKASPSVSVLLPRDFPSETVQIAYFLEGSFGGYQSYTDPQAGLHSYEIATSRPLLAPPPDQSRDNKAETRPATRIKMIVYAPGCEIQTFNLPLSPDSRAKEEFDCRPVAKVTLSGQIERRDLVGHKRAELFVTYMATWAYGFFGISDGAETEFEVASVFPDVNARFEVDLPYFQIDAAPPSPNRSASFRLMLRDPKTWNPIAFNLEPAAHEFMTEEHTLRIQSHYPANLKFIETPQQQKQ